MTDAPQKLHFLKEWREFRNLTQAQLAEAASTDKSVVSLIERGKRGLSDEWAHTFAFALQTRPGLLYENPYLLDTALLRAIQEIPEANKQHALDVLATFQKRA